MRLIFLGSGGSVLTPARHTTGLYLPEHGILLDAGTNVFPLGDVTVRTLAVPHSAPVLAYRLEFPSGESLAYVTDTTAPGEHLEFIRGADVLVHECTFSAEAAQWAGITSHSESAGVGRLAR